MTQTIETLSTFRLHIDQRGIVKDVRYKLDGIHETTLELDSHADTCVLGCGALIILDYRLVWAKKVSLGAICLVAGSASFGLREN